MVNNYGIGDQQRITLERDRFRPNWRKGQVVTQRCTTTYTPIYDKGTHHLSNITLFRQKYKCAIIIGIVDASLDVYPFGYIGPAVEDALRTMGNNNNMT